jgi:HAD superfamily hydrolase (TIGR01484 family)
MRLFVIATDYDGTLATNGRVGESTSAALRKLKRAGCKLLLVTGRQLEDLVSTFDESELFDLLVLENGALIYNPATKQRRLLCEPPPQNFAEALRAAGVKRLGCGEAIVATWHPYEEVVLETIRHQGLDLQVIFNKDAVMVLPAGVNKASGLATALEELAISPRNVIAVGDAENDLAFLKISEFGVAVANALPAVKDAADYVTSRDHGGGVEELVERILSGDVEEAANVLERRQLPLGVTTDGRTVSIPPAGSNILFAGHSGAGKSTVAAGVVQRLRAAGYQFCLVDPEGDYEALGNAIVLGNAKQIPSYDEVLNVLHQPTQNLVINLLGVKLADRSAYFAGLMTRLKGLWRESRRPHWVVVDETHHVLPADDGTAPSPLSNDGPSLMMITVDPKRLDHRTLRLIDNLVVVGDAAKETIINFCQLAKLEAPDLNEVGDLNKREALLWLKGGKPQRIIPLLGERESKRHRRKYATGEIGPDRSFYFRGPLRRLNLRVYNLETFINLAEGVDDETWMFHLRRRDYSRWFRETIKDSDLADNAQRVENDADLGPQESRSLIRRAIEERYTGRV